MTFMVEIENELRRYELTVFAMDHYNLLGLVRSIGMGASKKPIVIAEKSKTDVSSYSKYIKVRGTRLL